MHIEKVSGKRKDIWSVLYYGYCWYETYGPSMTEWASLHTIDRLLSIEDEGDIQRFEKSLPSEIGSLNKLMTIILDKIEIEQKGNTPDDDEKLTQSIEQIPLIKEMIRKLKKRVPNA